VINPNDIDVSFSDSIRSIYHQNLLLVSEGRSWHGDDSPSQGSGDFRSYEQAHRQGRAFIDLSRVVSGGFRKRRSIGVPDSGDYVNHPASRIDFSLGANNLADPLVFSACESGAQDDLGALVELGAGTHVGQIDESELSIRDRQTNLGKICGVEFGDRHSPTDKLTDIDVFFSDSAFERGRNSGSLEIPEGLVKGNARGIEDRSSNS